MHILHIDTGRTLRGGQWQLLLLARGLKARGVRQTVLARDPLRARLAAEGIATGAPSLWNVRSRAASVIHAHDARAHTLAAAAMRRPLIVSRRVAFPPGAGWWSRLKYSRADLYLAVSQYVAQRLEAAGLDAARIRVVYDGAEPLPATQGGALILAPHSDDPMKGSVIVKETGLPVHFSQDLPQDLARARVFVYLSHEEGLGSAVLLAQSAGVPVVASRVGGLPELVIHEETGLLTENDPAAVRRAIERLDDDTELARRLAGNARARFEASFTVDRMVERTLAAYEEVTRA